MIAAEGLMGDTTLIREGPYAGESLTHEHGYWHFTDPDQVLQRFPWVVAHGPRTKEGVVLGSYHSRGGGGSRLVLDRTFHEKESLGTSLCCANSTRGCGWHAGKSHTHTVTGEHLFYYNLVMLEDTPSGLLCPMCAALAREENGEPQPDEDEDDDGDEEEASVPAKVLAALPRRASSSRIRGPCAICLDSLAKPGLVVVKLPCEHEFCEGCIETWLSQAVACPTCRRTITDEP